MMNAPSRIKTHRARAAAKGMRRIEVVVNGADAPVIRRAAEILRAQGEAADALRRMVRGTEQDGLSGLDLLENLRRLVPPGPGLDLSRDDLAADRDVVL